MSLVLSIDQGTTSTKAVLLDLTTGEILARSSVPVAIAYPRPGWVEQDPADIWQTVCRAAAECLAAAPRRPLAVTVSSQRESVTLWRASDGSPVGPMLGWQDSRTAEYCHALQGSADLVRSRTGLSLDAMYSAPKLRWLLNHAARAGHPVGDLRAGTVDSWLVHKLTGGHLIEAGNAARTLLMDIQKLRWDSELLALFEIPRSVLPEIAASDGDFGRITTNDFPITGIPVAAVLADSHAALYHHGRGNPAIAKATYGTGSSVMSPTSGALPSDTGVTTTLAWLTDQPQYASEGNILASGAALDWAARLLSAPAGVPGGQYLTELAAQVDSSDGVVLVPAFTGLGAPHWDRQAVSVLCGMTASTGPAHVARAALDGVAHQVCDVLEAVIAQGGQSPEQLITDGGATASALLMQIQADLLGRDVTVSAAAEASALGAAEFAAQPLDLPPVPVPVPTATYRPREESVRLTRREEWNRAIARARATAAPVAPQSLSPELITTGDDVP